MLSRAALLLCLLSLSDCEKSPAAPPAPPAVVVVPAPVPIVAPPTDQEILAGALPTEGLRDGGDGKPVCPIGQFYVHGGCHTANSVGIAGPNR
jgi:hypothetical protein